MLRVYPTPETTETPAVQGPPGHGLSPLNSFACLHSSSSCKVDEAPVRSVGCRKGLTRTNLTRCK